jgi:peptide/nickel transport system substrate-binding protein
MARRCFLIGLVGVLLVACAPAVPTSAPSAPASPNAPASNRTLSLLMRVEPKDMLEATDDRFSIHRSVFSANLGGWDQQGNSYGLLAARPPQPNTESWRLLPDGRMETVYPLRPGLTWHDGTPLVAEDFAFAARVQKARVQWGHIQNSAELLQIEEVLAPDSQTVVFRWRQTFTEAAGPLLFPAPRHILGAVFEQGDPDAFASQPYWTTEYVGAGPFRLERWERGGFMEGAAFAGYALGQPKIQRVRITWNNDPTVNLTRLLSNDADLATDGAIAFEQARLLRDQWKDAGAILLNPTNLRYLQLQSRTDYLSPRVMQDVRARQALVHGIDRSTLAEAMVDDAGMAADTFPPPTVPYFQAVQRAVAKYPYDPRRTEQLLGELGYPRAADGYFASPTDGRVRMELWGVAGGQDELDTTVVHHNVHRSGIDLAIVLHPSSLLAGDDRMRATFPGLRVSNNTLARRDLGLEKFISARLAGPHNNWVGGNTTGWVNAEFDRLHEQCTTSLDAGQRTDRLVSMMRIMADELPALPLYYTYQVIAHDADLRGPQPLSPESTRFGNLHEWIWQSR